MNLELNPPHKESFMKKRARQRTVPRAATRYPRIAAGIFLAAGCGVPHAAEQVRFDGYTELDVRPSTTDPRIRNEDLPSRVIYDPRPHGGKILLYLLGTDGTTEHIPANLLGAALAQRYRVIVLSYITEPGVSQVCIGRALRADPECAAKFREKRIYGDGLFSLIPDRSQDAIVNRLQKLFEYLGHSDPAGEWGTYLRDGRIRWDRIAVAGQSQGGGMAEFIAKRETVDRVIAFSGGWDFSAPSRIASWYSEASSTPPERWYGTYHVREAESAALTASYRALRIPPDHVFALDLPLPAGRRISGKNPYHGQGDSNPAYRAIWEMMLGDGSQ